MDRLSSVAARPHGCRTRTSACRPPGSRQQIDPGVEAAILGLTPLGFTARVAPSWGGQAMSGSEALWGRDTMQGLARAGSPAAGNQLDAELGYALPVGSRLVGTPRFGVTTTEMGRDYRLGYSLAVLQGGAMNFQFGLDAQRRESLLGQGNPDHSLLGRITATW